MRSPARCNTRKTSSACRESSSPVRVSTTPRGPRKSSEVPSRASRLFTATLSVGWLTRKSFDAPVRLPLRAIARK